MAAEVGTAAAGNLVAEYASPYLSYFFRFGQIVEDFKRQREALQSKKDQVKVDVDEALRQTEVIMEGVKDWLTEAVKELGEAQSLEDEIQGKKCFNWCPSWGWRYCLSMKVAKKTLRISQLLDGGNFSRVGKPAPLPGLEIMPSKDFMPSESSNLAFKEIMEALKNGDVNMIGLYGMGGVGKTTLAFKQVGNQAKQLFDEVVVVTVSQTPNINTIQDKLADFLHLKFEKTTTEGRAEQLWLRVKGVNRILVILDDVWEEISLKAIGIPLGDDHKGSKILLTTRRQQVCARMNCQKEVRLNILSEVEAWDLFKEKASIKDDCPISNVAKEVASECKGLPLAINVMAKALKDEIPDGWIAANRRLKESWHLENQDFCEGIYNCLKFSFDYLKEDNIQSCFLLCSLFPEDYNINIELLIICGIGQGLFRNIHVMEDLRREIRLALSKLKKSGLLLETDNERFVKMHDVIRDFAHWIASEGKNIFMVKDRLTEYPMSESFDHYTAISLWNSKIDTLPNKLQFSKLKTFFLEADSLRNVSSTIFEQMKSLQVLLLKNVILSLEAVQFLTNLRTLCFLHCKLENSISSLQGMNKLEILALLDTNIEELPEELVGLDRLKSLYFSSRKQHSNFPPNLLSRLASLQELHVTSGNNANLLELNSLSRLTGLAMTLSSDPCSQENFLFPKLKSYNIAVNLYLEDLEGLSLRTLRIGDFSSSLNAFKDLFCNMEVLTLENITMEHKNIVPNVDKWGLKELTSLRLAEVKDLECLVDTTRGQSSTTALSNLVNLVLRGMTCLKELCHGQPPSGFLKKLKTLSIENCQQLQSVFQMIEIEASTSSLSSLHLDSLPELKCVWKGSPHFVSLQNLKLVNINDCRKLEYLFSPSLAQSLVSIEELKIGFCKELQHIMTELDCENQIESDGHLHSPFLPKLRKIEIRYCPRLEYVFQIPLADEILPRLESIEIVDCSQLQQVFKVAKEYNGVVRATEFPRLQKLELQFLINLRCFCSEYSHIALPSLEELVLHCCPRLTDSNFQKEVIEKAPLKKLYLSASEDAEGSATINFFVPIFATEARSHFLSRIEELCLDQLQQLQGPIQVANLQCLKRLRVSQCNRLKYLLSPVLARNFPQLIWLGIYNCEGLEEIIEMDQTSASSSSQLHLQPISFPSLRYIEIRECSNLKSLSSISVSRSLSKLEEILIWRASKFERVFGCEGEVDVEDDHKEITLSYLSILGLEDLPSLESFGPMGYHFRFPHLNYLGVRGCSKSSTRFSIDRERVVHVVTETSELVEQDAAEGSAIAQDIGWMRWRQHGLPPYEEGL